MIYIATDKVTGETFRYEADAPVAWGGMGFDTHDHVPQTEEVVPAPERDPWRIHVGAFFDRFGEHKIAILASQDPYVQAVIKDVSVRKYIALTERREELALAIGLLNSKGFPVDPAAVLDVEPTEEEIWHG